MKQPKHGEGRIHRKRHDRRHRHRQGFSSRHHQGAIISTLSSQPKAHSRGSFFANSKIKHCIMGDNHPLSSSMRLLLNNQMGLGMILFKDRPSFEDAWKATKFRVVMAGMGDDTTMVIAEMYKRGYEPNEIVFADTGSEHKHTYKAIEHLRKWCSDRNWSKVVVLNKTDKYGEPLSVIETAEIGKTLPGAAFGIKSCTMRFKTETADKYFNNHKGCWDAWGVTGKGRSLSSHTGSILRIVGINADETHRIKNWKPEDKWCQVFPLVDWEIGERESSAVEEVGLYYPGKSSCICCPHMNGHELYNLKVMYPEDYERIKNMERNYQQTNMTPESSTIGMCRNQTIDQKISEWTDKRVVRGNGGCETCAIQ